MTSATGAVREHEVFPNAPLQLVAVEVTYPKTDERFDPGLFAAVQGVLGEGSEGQLGGQMRVIGPPNPDGAAPAEAMLFRMTNADRTVSVSAWPTSLIVECTEYRRFEEWRELVRSVVDAYVRFTSPSAVTRFGMRYIDEVHVPVPIKTVEDWSPYVADALLAPGRLVDEQITNLATGFTVDLGQHRLINVRCATAPGRAIASEGHLRMRERPDTPALVLDIDAFFQPPEPMTTAVTGDLVARIAEELRPGVRRVFDAAFTDKALKTFRTKEVTA